MAKYEYTCACPACMEIQPWPLWKAIPVLAAFYVIGASIIGILALGVYHWVGMWCCGVDP